MAKREVLSVRISQQAQHERVPERLEAYAKDTGRTMGAISLEAIRLYLNALEKPNPIPALTEAVNRLNKSSMSMFDTVSSGILSNQERVTRNGQLINAIISILSDEDQKSVVHKAMSLMQSQAASDEQIAQYEAQEAQGIETPLGRAEKNLQQMREDGRARENPDRN